MFQKLGIDMHGWNHTVKIISLTMLFMLVSLSSCVPEVVKHNAEGNTRFEQGAYPEALDAYRLAQVSEPDKSEPYYNAANAYNRQGDVNGTFLQTEQALKSTDTNLQANAWYNLGNAYFDAQQWQPAIEAYKEALRINPQDGDAKHNLELALKMNQDSQKESDSDQENPSESGDENQDQQQPLNQENESGTPEEEQESGGSEDQQMREGTQEMSPEQAQQLLEALLDDSETLQEHLQQHFQVPGGAPEEDW